MGQGSDVLGPLTLRNVNGLLLQQYRGIALLRLENSRHLLGSSHVISIDSIFVVTVLLEGYLNCI